MNKIFAFSLILMPILFQYSINIATVTMGDVCLAISLFILVLKFKLKFNFTFVYLFFFLVFELIYSQIMDIYASPWTALRYMFYIFVIIFVPTIAKEYKFIIRLYVICSLLASSLLILQYICIHIFNIYLPGVIQFLPLTDSTLLTYNVALNDQVYKRVMSCFGEPSHFAIYVLGALIIVLSINNVTKKDIFIAFYITLAIFLSTSITGILLAILIWLIFIKRQLSFRIDKIILISITFLMLFGVLGRAQSTLYIMNPTIFIRQLMGRIPGYIYVFNTFMDDKLQYLIGHGMHDIGEIVYLSGYPRLLYYFGVFGTCIFIACFVSLYSRGNILGNYMLFIVAILSIGTEVIFGPLLIPYITVILITKYSRHAIQISV